MRIGRPITVCAIAVGMVIPLRAQEGATISGRVRLTAEAPRNPRIPMGADPNCLTINAGKRVVQETVLRSSDGGLANVFVQLKGSLPKGGGAKPAVIDQKGCVYHPRIQGARVGQSLEVRNSDQTLHNIHSMTTKGNTFNTGQPMAGMVFRYTLKSEEVMLHVKCDVHPWMSGYIGVVDHPYYTVTDANGGYRISGVPPGKQTVQVWHERYGFLTQTVDVKKDGTVNADFAYTGNEKPATASLQELMIPAGATGVELVLATTTTTP